MPASSTWVVIDALVHEIGALSAQVHMAERTIASDPRTPAARQSLDRATEAVCLAIDETSDRAARRARHAIAETRRLLSELGLLTATGDLAQAARKLMATSEREQVRGPATRSAAAARRRRIPPRVSPRR